jgi:hypothetical protein
VGAGDHLDRFGLGAVGSDRAQLVGVGADHVGQHMGVIGVAFGARDRVPLAVPGGLQRVDREHLVAGHDQRHDPGAPVGLDADQHLDVLVSTSWPASSPMIACNLAIPATPSGRRALASRRPAASSTSTS